MVKLNGKNWDIDTDTNTINIHSKLTTEQLARIVDSIADYEREFYLGKSSMVWSIDFDTETKK